MLLRCLQQGAPRLVQGPGVGGQWCEGQGPSSLLPGLGVPPGLRLLSDFHGFSLHPLSFCLFLSLVQSCLLPSPLPVASPPSPWAGVGRGPLQRHQRCPLSPAWRGRASEPGLSGLWAPFSLVLTGPCPCIRPDKLLGPRPRWEPPSGPACPLCPSVSFPPCPWPSSCLSLCACLCLCFCLSPWKLIFILSSSK